MPDKWEYPWWVNRQDPEGKNLFSGGFLGLDNIGVFDRSQDLPTGGLVVPSHKRWRTELEPNVKMFFVNKLY